MIREIERTITLDNAVYRVRKFPVITGAYFLKFVVEKILPALEGIQKVLNSGKKKGENAEINFGNLLNADVGKLVGVVLPVLTSVKQEDMTTIITTCLSFCEKQLPAGFTRVASQNGQFGVAELEYDLVTCLKLCFEVLKFNLEGFFGEGGLDLNKLPQNTSLLSPLT